MKSPAVERLDGALLIATATLGTLPVALLSSACLARFLPLSADARYALAFSTAIPIWLTAMCVIFLARSGKRSALACLVASSALATMVFAVPH